MAGGRVIVMIVAVSTDHNPWHTDANPDIDIGLGRRGEQASGQRKPEQQHSFHGEPLEFVVEPIVIDYRFHNCWPEWRNSFQKQPRRQELLHKVARVSRS